ncbi:MAG: Bug family tripartite tricarboxylate transporter substrate binding protein [Lautropia sp.]
MLRLALLFLCLSIFSLDGWSQSWPNRSVRMIVPFPAGGATDAPARLLAEKLSEKWKQPVVVENRTGAGGSIGAGEAARSAPDGYTMLIPSGALLTASQYVQPSLPYDPEADFELITKLVAGPQVLVVPARSPFGSTGALLDFARQNPRKLSYGHAGIGSQSHLAGEYFLLASGVDAEQVPYKGDPPAAADLIGGVLDFGVLNLAAVAGHIESGRIKALALTTPSPLPQLAKVPLIADTIPGFDNSGWFGLVVPKGVPPDVTRRIVQDTRAVLADAAVRARLEALGFTVIGNSPQQMRAEVEAERKRWERVVRERKIKSSP